MKFRTTGEASALILSINVYPNGVLYLHCTGTQIDYSSIDDLEINADDDVAHIIKFNVDGAVVSWADIISEALYELPDLIAETEEAEEEERRMEEELSSPYLTGRI